MKSLFTLIITICKCAAAFCQSYTFDFCSSAETTVKVSLAAYSYGFKLPDGWVTSDGKTSTGTIFDNSIKIKPVKCPISGTISVVGAIINPDLTVSYVQGSISLNVSVPVVSVSPPSGYVGSFTCNTTPVIFTANLSPSIGCLTGYSWTYPSGWTFVSQAGNTITLKPSGTAVDSDPNNPITASAFFICGSVIKGSYNPIYTATTISGASPFCSTGQFSLVNQQTGTTATWSSSTPSGLSINASTGVATRVNNYNGQVNISATVSGSCGSIPVPPLTVWVGAPGANIGTLIYPTGSRGVNPVSTSPGATYIFNVDPVPYTSSYTWVLPAGFSVLWGSATTVSTSINITTSTAVGSYTLFCAANNDCGSAYTNSLAINNGTAGGGSKCPPGVLPPCKPGPVPLLVYPNPASSAMTVTVADSLRADASRF